MEKESTSLPEMKTYIEAKTVKTLGNRLGVIGRNGEERLQEKTLQRHLGLFFFGSVFDLLVEPH